MKAKVSNTSNLACAMARLTMMLAWAIFRSYWGFCKCVDKCMCDRTCLRAWTELPL